MSSNKYEDMSVLEALKKANNHQLLLPDIQREYVWDIAEIECLFESIIDDYPIGSCIFWKTNRTTINNEKPNLYYFFSKFEKDKTKNEKAPEVINEESDYYIVLDGQQRVTSMNIALNGSYKYYKGGRGHNRLNPKFWVEKEMYYNLDYYQTDEIDDEHPKKRFCFLSKEEVSSGKFLKINLIQSYDSLEDFIEYMIKNNFSKECRKDLSKLFERIHSSSDNGLIHYYCINEKSYDNALDIFVRVNSTGKKLSKSDLLFSTLIDGWENGKKNIEGLLEIMNNKGDGFQFTRDYLMRLCLILVGADTNLKIKSLTNTIIQNIRANWDIIHASLDTLTTILTDIGVCHENLTSYNATMPIAYYIYKGGKFNNKNSKIEAKKFLSVALAKRLFGVASNDALNQTRNAINNINCKKENFSLNIFKNITLTGGRIFVTEEKDIDYWLDNYEKGQNTFFILSLLYPNLKLSQVSFHQDHCHPFTSFESKKIGNLLLSPEKIKEWQKKRNLIPNLQFLQGLENESKNKTPLKQWVEEGNDFEYHPKGISLELKDFDEFFKQRRELIKKKLMEILI